MVTVEPSAPRSASPAVGVTRPPRRPAGWRAPGPSPAGGGGDPELNPGPGEDLCYLLGDWRILQRVDGHRWSLDDLVTAWLATRVTRQSPPRRHLDLGTGVGSVLLMLAWHQPHREGVGVEAQAISVGLARRSLRYNGVHDRCRIIHADLRDFDAGGPRWDLITGTPPYFEPGRATPSTAPQKGPCRVELRGGVEVYAAAAARALAPAGTFVCCHAARQRPRLLAAAAAVGLHPHRILDVTGRVGKPPLVTVGVFRRAPRHAPPIEESLAVRSRSSQWTPEFRALRRMMGMPDRAP